MLVAIGLGELLLPVLFEDGSEALRIGRWFVFSIVLVLGVELYCGLLLGLHDFFVYNALRLAQPALTALAFIVLWRLDALTVESALIATSAATVVALAVGFGRVVARVGIGRARLPPRRPSLWYGVRGQGSSVATNLTARLDVAMLPAYVSNASVGIYSVAANVSLIVYALANTFSGSGAAGSRT